MNKIKIKKKELERIKETWTSGILYPYLEVKEDKND
jgi:hypothetical protein